MAAASYDPGFDLVSVQATQGIQRSGEGPLELVPLIAQRSLAVRVRLQKATIEPIQVTGRLHLLVNHVDLHPAGYVSEPGVFEIPPAIEDAMEGATLNFFVPAPTGIEAGADVSLQIEIHRLDCRGTIIHEHPLGVAVEPMPLRLFGVAIDYRPKSGERKGPPCACLTERFSADAFIRGAFPVNDADPKLYTFLAEYEGHSLPIVFVEGLGVQQGSEGGAAEDAAPNGEDVSDDDGDGKLERGEDAELLTMLSMLRSVLIENQPQAAVEATFVYGWVRDDQVEDNGWARCGDYFAYGNTQPVRFQRTFAHEIAHLMGMHHVTAVGPDRIGGVGFDPTEGLYRNPVGNSVLREQNRTKSDLYRLMAPGKFTDETWLSAEDFSALLDPPVCEDSEPQADAPGYVVVRGAVTRDGSGLRYLAPIAHYQGSTLPAGRRAGGEFQLRLEYGSKLSGNTVVSSSFDALGYPDSDQAPRYGYFEASVPVPRGEPILDLGLSRGGAPLSDARNRSMAFTLSDPNASDPGPVVTILDERWPIVEFRVERSPAPGPVMYQLAFSSDGGRAWVPVGVNFGDEIPQLDWRQLPSAGVRQGILRVYVSQGLRTDVAELRR